MATQIAVSRVKSHLAGLDRWLDAAAKSDCSLTDNYIQEVIVPQAIAQFQLDTATILDRTQVCSCPDGTYAPSMSSTQEGQMGMLDLMVDDYANPDGPQIPGIIETPYNFWSEDAYEFFRVYLNFKPILHVQRMRLVWNNGVLLYQVPTEWLHYEAPNRFFILPLSGGASFTSAALQFAMINSTYGIHGVIPGIVSIDYIAGHPANWQQFARHQALEMALEEYCAMYVMERIQDAINGGLLNAQMSAAGASQAFNPSRFQQRLQYLKQKLAEFKQSYINQNTGIMFGVA